MIISTFSMVVSSGLNESALDLERPSFADDGRDLDSPLSDFLFGVPLSPPTEEKRLALRGRILCWLGDSEPSCDDSFLSDSASTSTVDNALWSLLRNKLCRFRDLSNHVIIIL